MKEVLRTAVTVAVFASCLTSLPARLDAQATCRPPTDLRVCQDTYGPSDNRVFLVWTNGETSYSSIEVTINGEVAGEAPGTARLAYIDELAPGSYTFGVRGHCGATTSTEATQTFQVVTATPHDNPLDSLSCTYDAGMSRWTVTLDLGADPSLFIDVYRRRAGNGFLEYVRTVFGDSTAITVAGAATDRLFFQFFDENCYGSEFLSCPPGPPPPCVPVTDVTVCQDIYGATRGRVFVRWTPGAANYTGFDVFLDGVKVGTAGAGRRMLYVDPVTPGAHTFEVQGICDAESASRVVHPFTVLTSSPHTSPQTSLRCAYDATDRVLSATWSPGPQPSEFIDVYLRIPGNSLLDFRATVAGDRTRVDLPNADPDDEVVLQFFNEACYGSPLITCTEGPGDGFIRGDTDGSGRVEITDSVSTLGYLFLGSREPLCFDAADSNDDARIDIGDAVFVLNWLFGDGSAPPAPGGLSCGTDPTADPFPECLTAACP